MLIINADDCGGRDSVMAQTWLPERWEIVDGGSTDRIAKIVPGYTIDLLGLSLSSVLSTVLRFKKVDSFRVAMERQ